MSLFKHGLCRKDQNVVLTLVPWAMWQQIAFILLIVFAQGAKVSARLWFLLQ
jgi:hypothetical protein